MKKAENCPRPMNGMQPSQHSLTRITSKQLFAGNRQIFIEHAGQEYRLQITRHGKLILTK